MKADYKERLKIVLQVLQPLQFSKALIIRTVRNLLNVYGVEAGWSYIEEDEYKNVLNCIVAERNEKRGQKISHAPTQTESAGETQDVHEFNRRFGKTTGPTQAIHVSPAAEMSTENCAPSHHEDPDSPDIHQHQRRLWSQKIGIPPLACFRETSPVLGAEEPEVLLGSPGNVTLDTEKSHEDNVCSNDKPNREVQDSWDTDGSNSPKPNKGRCRIRKAGRSGALLEPRDEAALAQELTGVSPVSDFEDEGQNQQDLCQDVSRSTEKLKNDKGGIGEADWTPKSLFQKVVSDSNQAPSSGQSQSCEQEGRVANDSHDDMDMRGKLGGQIKTRDQLDHRDLPTVKRIVGVKGKRPDQIFPVKKVSNSESNDLAATPSPPKKARLGANAVDIQSCPPVVGGKVPKGSGCGLLSMDSEEKKMVPGNKSSTKLQGVATKARGDQAEGDSLCGIPGVATALVITRDGTATKEIDVGRTTAFKLGGKKGSSSFLQRQKRSVTIAEDFSNRHISHVDTWSLEACLTRAPPLGSPPSGLRSNAKVSAVTNCSSDHDQLLVGQGANAGELVIDPTYTVTKPDTHAVFPLNKVPQPSLSGEVSNHETARAAGTGIAGSSSNRLLELDKYNMQLRSPLSVSELDEAPSPELPPGFANQISHKRDLAATVALHQSGCALSNLQKLQEHKDFPERAIPGHVWGPVSQVRPTAPILLDNSCTASAAPCTSGPLQPQSPLLAQSSPIKNPSLPPGKLASVLRPINTSVKSELTPQGPGFQLQSSIPPFMPPDPMPPRLPPNQFPSVAGMVSPDLPDSLPQRPLPSLPSDGTQLKQEYSFGPLHPPGPSNVFPPEASCLSSLQSTSPHSNNGTQQSSSAIPSGWPSSVPSVPPPQLFPPGMEPVTSMTVTGTPLGSRLSSIAPSPTSLISNSFPPPMGTNSAIPSVGHKAFDARRDAREHAKSIFVGNIPVGLVNTILVIREALEAYFKPLEFVPAKSAEIQHISLYERSTGSYAFAQFSSEVFARIVLDACQVKSMPLQVNGVQLSVGRNLKAEMVPAMPRERMFKGDRVLDPAKMLYVGNLPEQWRSEQLLQKRFSEILGGSNPGADSNFLSAIYILPECVDVYLELSSDVVADALVYKCIKDSKLLESMGDSVFICRHPKFVPLFALASKSTSCTLAIPNQNVEKPLPKDSKLAAEEESASRWQSTLYVGNLPLTAEAYNVHDLREVFDRMLCCTLEDKPVVRWVKAVTWPPGRHYAHVEFNSELAANAIMDAYIEQTAEFCLNDAAFCMFRHQKYVRPGAVYKTTNHGVLNLNLTVEVNQEKKSIKNLSLESQSSEQCLDALELDGEEGDESLDESVQAVHMELKPDEMAAAVHAVPALIKGVNEVTEQGNVGGWSTHLYKTRLCNKFNNGGCPYGARCRYAHGVEELLRPAPPQMPHAQGRRSAVTPPLGSSSSTGLTTDFTGRQDTTDTGDEYVDPKSVICVRGVAGGLTSFSLKGAMNELFERTLKTTGVLEFGKHVVRYSQFKDNSKQALVTLLNVEAATAILSVVEPLKIAGQPLVILPWSNMQQQKLQPLPKANAGQPGFQPTFNLGDTHDVLSSSPGNSRAPHGWLPPSWSGPEQPWSVHPPGLSSVECPPHVGQFGPPPQTGMVPLPFLPTQGQPDFGRPPLPSGPLCHPSFGPHNGIRPPPPWTPSPPIPSAHHLQSPGGDGWPAPPSAWVEPHHGLHPGNFGWRHNEGVLHPDLISPPLQQHRDGVHRMHFSHEDTKFRAELLCQSSNKVDKNTGGWLEDDDDEPGMPASEPATGDGDRRGVDPEGGRIISEEASASNVDPFQHKQVDSGAKAELATSVSDHIHPATSLSDVSRSGKQTPDIGNISFADQNPISSQEPISSRDSHWVEDGELRREGNKRKRETDRSGIEAKGHSSHDNRMTKHKLHKEADWDLGDRGHEAKDQSRKSSRDREVGHSSIRQKPHHDRRDPPQESDGRDASWHRPSRSSGRRWDVEPHEKSDRESRRKSDSGNHKTNSTSKLDRGTIDDRSRSRRHN